MNEMENVQVPVNRTFHSEEEMRITGDELEYRTFFLDEYQVGLVNDMGRGHRVILANPGAGKACFCYLRLLNMRVCIKILRFY